MLRSSRKRSLRSMKVESPKQLPGIPSIEPLIIVYGMGVDLATVLAVMGTIWTGDPLSLDPSFSIGGRDPGVNNLLGDLGGLLSQYIHLRCRFPILSFCQANLKV